MANTLIKVIDLYKIPGTPGTPGDPGEPPTGTRQVKRKKRVCTWEYDWVYTPRTKEGGGGQGYADGGRKVCRNVEYIEYEPVGGRPPSPSMPGKPEKIKYVYNLGWNARARAVEVIEGAGRATFTVPVSTVGAVVGLSKAPATSGFLDIEHGFYVTKGVVRIYESGQEKDYFGLIPNAELAVERSGGVIRYYINGTEERSVATSEAAPMFLAAAMYSGGDMVRDATIEEFASGSGVATFPSLQAFGGAGWSSGLAEFPVMGAEGAQASYATGYAEFAELQAYGGTRWASGSATFPLMTADSDALDVAPPYALGDVMFPGITTVGTGTTGEIGGGGGEFDIIEAIGADRPYAYGRARMNKPDAEGVQWLEADELAFAAFNFVADEMVGEVELFALIDSSMTFHGLMSVQVLGAATMESGLSWSDAMATTQIINALIQSLMNASTGALGGAEPMTVWTLHTDAGGSTRYEGYDFTSFAKVDGKYYGCKSDGLYLLEGPDDAGEQVAARVNFGNLSFGTEARKALPYVYAGMASDGKTYLKVTADDKTYTYEVRHNTKLMKTHRFELGRGLRASFYELELVADGTIFDLHSIDFQPIELTRRL